MSGRLAAVALSSLVLMISLSACATSADREPEAGGMRSHTAAPQTVGEKSTTDSDDLIAYRGPSHPDDSEWLLKTVNGDDAAKGSDINAIFPVDGEFSIEGGCMGFSLYHKLENGRVRPVEPGLQVGSYNCGKPEAVQQQARDVLKILRGLASMRITVGQLILRGLPGEGAVFTHPRPAQVDPALVGTAWILISMGGDEPIPGTRLTLEIRGESIGGFSGCNAFGSAIDKMDEGVLAWSHGTNDGFASTQVGCPKRKLSQEWAYQRMVASARAYRIDGDRLQLEDGDGKILLIFREKVR